MTDPVIVYVTDGSGLFNAGMALGFGAMLGVGSALWLAALLGKLLDAVTARIRRWRA